MTLTGFLTALFMLAMYAIMFWVIWKFYYVLARMNENLNGIRQALERGGPRRAED
jgi:hypothetical protein